MSGKKSLFVGAILGGLAAGATIYALKTKNGQETTERAKEKLIELKDRAQVYIEKQGYTSAEIKQGIADFVTQASTQIFPNQQKKSSTEADYSNADVNKEFLQIENELQNLERNLQK